MVDDTRTAAFNRRQFLMVGGAAVGLAAVAGDPLRATSAHAAEAAGSRRPNVVVVLADDLGWGEIGSFGQTKISTPNLDRLAREGVRYTDFHAGGPVCAPSRCSMLTGMHSGHATVRNNPEPGNGDEPLRADEVTFALLLQTMGYRTALMGKWGFSPDDPGHHSSPNSQGFDEFFGYLTHIHAHDYYPSYLWHNTDRIEFPENAGSAMAAYAPDLFADRALRFIDQHHADPFLLMLSTNVPHSPQQVPDLGQYATMDWSDGDRAHAAQITRMDGDIGRIVAKLEERGIADDTVFLFMSDNGPHEEGAPSHDPDFFDASGPFTGYKRNLLEGGIRVPAIVWAPGLTGQEPGGPAGTVEETPWAMWDVLPTLADLAGAPMPPFVDGRSMRSTFDAASAESVAADRPLYWWRLEPYTTPRAQAVEGGRVRNAAEALRQGDWKALRYAPARDRSVPDSDWSVELYHLASDPGETTNVAALHPEVAASLVALMKQAWIEPPMDRPAWRPDGLTIDAPEFITAGIPTVVPVTMANQFDTTITNVTVELLVPDGWSVAGRRRLPFLRAGRLCVTSFDVVAGLAVTEEQQVVALVRFVRDGEAREATLAAPVQSTPAPPQSTSFVSDLAWLSSANAWGPVERDMSNGRNGAGDGPAISIGGQEWAKGLGVHAPSEVVVYVGGACSRFTSVVGIDDFSARQSSTGSVVFQVWGDGSKLYDSGLVTAALGARSIDLPITGVDVLRLVVTDSGNGNTHDHASWADAIVHVG
ncbi:sulfatase-like hydrolase/transferase [Agromyces sp. CCNWLW203]|uniref:sulfatase-like hydrolase/transferase n=1 Tax=Agromyces sp. CCNWLW203 TaxID=3112842 RepID=UPI002F96C049